MDTSKTDSLQVPRDDSEEQSDPKTRQMRGRDEKIGAGDSSLGVGMGIRSYTGWMNAKFSFKSIQK